LVGQPQNNCFYTPYHQAFPRYCRNRQIKYFEIVHFPLSFTSTFLLDIMYLIGYHVFIVKIKQTEAYEEWFNSLSDGRAKARIDVRIRRMSLGNPGETRSVGEGVMELKIDYGPGYRVYYLSKGKTVVILLAGGDKKTQNKDIARAKALAKEIQKER